MTELSTRLPDDPPIDDQFQELNGFVAEDGVSFTPYETLGEMLATERFVKAEDSAIVDLDDWQ